MPSELKRLLAENPDLAAIAEQREGLAQLASLLLQMRHSAQLTQADLARRSGVPATLISELENAANEGVTFRTLVRLAKGAGAALRLNLTLDDSAAGRVTTELVCPNQIDLSMSVPVSYKRVETGAVEQDATLAA